MSEPPAAATQDAWRLFWMVFAAALCANGVMLVIDHEPQFFDGDSMVYIGAAFGGGPGDRSFAYGRYIIRPLLWLFGSLNAVVVAQAVMAAACAGMLAVILRVGFATQRWLATVVALCYVAEPLSLLYQRMIMTEAPTLVFLALFLLLGVVYLNRPQLGLLFGLAAASVAGVAFRVSVLPVVMVSMVLLPPLALFRGWRPSRAMLTRCALHLAIGLGATFGLHALYKQLFHSVTGQPPAYNSADGFFLLASWAPLLTRADFPNPSLFDQIRPTLGDLEDRFTRPGQRYSPGGLIPRLIESELGNERLANDMSRQIAFNICRRDPLGVLLLGWKTYMDFWNPQVMEHVLFIDEGPQPADQPVIDLFRNRYGEDIEANHSTPTPTKWWHARAIVWYRIVLLSPAVWLAAFILRPQYWRGMLFIGLSVFGLLLVDTLLVIEPVVRYLHSLAWLTFLLSGVIIQSLRDLVAGIARPASLA
jgi:hypothetical protein